MVYTTQLIIELIDKINNSEDLDVDCTAIKGYDDISISRPISQTYLSFTCSEEKVTYSQDEDSEYCQSISIDININTFVPLTYSVLTARNIVEVVLKYLSDSYSDQITGYTIEEIDYDDDINAYKFTSHLYFEYNICAGESSASTALSSTSSFFCQTHVNDTSVHLTEDTLYKLNNPFVVGSYEGTGFSVYNTIDLGFRPSALFIFGASIPPVDTASSRIDSYFGFATQLGTSQGITLNSSGFSVRQNSGDASDSAIALINESDQTYHYIAFI